MSKIEVANFADALRRTLSLPGEDAPRDLAPELVGIFDLLNAPLSWQRFLGNGLYLAQVGVVAAATFNSRFQARFVGNATVFELEDLIIGSSTAQQLQVWIGNTATDLAGAGSYRARDSRIPGDQGDTWNTSRGSQVVCSNTNADTSTNGSLIHEYPVLASAPLRLELGLVCCNQRSVSPANPFIQVRALTVNTPLFVTLRWRERKMTDFENVQGA